MLPAFALRPIGPKAPHERDPAVAMRSPHQVSLGTPNGAPTVRASCGSLRVGSARPGRRAAHDAGGVLVRCAHRLALGGTPEETPPAGRTPGWLRRNGTRTCPKARTALYEEYVCKSGRTPVDDPPGTASLSGWSRTGPPRCADIGQSPRSRCDTMPRRECLAAPPSAWER
jgi:hypothetical protein